MEEIEKIKKALGIAKAICVKYSDEDVENSENYRVCDGILAAADGKVVKLNAGSCSCEGGKSYLGLSDSEVPLKLLVEREKLWTDVTIAFRSMEKEREIAEPPYGLAKNVYLYPSDKQIFTPDLVLFIANPAQASRLLVLNQFWDGSVSPFYMSGPICWSGITYPLMSGCMNLTVGDISARSYAELRDEHLLVSMPFERIEGMAEAIDLSTVGTAEEGKNTCR